MKKVAATIGSLFALWAVFTISPAVAQNPQFPQTLPPNTVVGRSGISAGPAQAIPFAALTPGLLAAASGDFACTLSPSTCTINAGVVGNSKLANMAANTIKCNPTGSSAVSQDCISPVVTSLIASTSLTSPLHIGGSTVGSSLTLQSTSAAGTTDFLSFQTGSQVETLRIDTAGKHLIGLTAALTNGDATFLTVENAGKSGFTGGAYGLFQFSNDTSSSFLGFFKNRGTVKGVGQTTVVNGDDIGELAFEASDGTNYVKTGYFTQTVNGPVSTGIVPSMYVWGQTSSAGTLFEGMRLSAAGHLRVGNANALPTNSACAGFSLAAVSSDVAGTVTFTSATTCTINFGTAFINAPKCSVTPNTTASTVGVSQTTTQLSASFGAAQTSMTWICLGV